MKNNQATTLPTATLKVIATSIYHHFRVLDNPPADKIEVPIGAMKEDRKEKGTVYATVRFIKEWCGRREHSIRIKFNIDEKGRFLSNTWSYA